MELLGRGPARRLRSVRADDHRAAARAIPTRGEAPAGGGAARAAGHPATAAMRCSSPRTPGARSGRCPQVDRDPGGRVHRAVRRAFHAPPRAVSAARSRAGPARKHPLPRHQNAWFSGSMNYLGSRAHAGRPARVRGDVRDQRGARDLRAGVPATREPRSRPGHVTTLRTSRTCSCADSSGSRRRSSR